MSKNTRRDTYYIVESILFPKVVCLVCCYCGGKAARGGNDIEGEYSHIKCHAEASK